MKCSTFALLASFAITSSLAKDHAQVIRRSHVKLAPRGSSYGASSESGSSYGGSSGGSSGYGGSSGSYGSAGDSYGGSNYNSDSGSYQSSDAGSYNSKDSGSGYKSSDSSTTKGSYNTKGSGYQSSDTKGSYSTSTAQDYSSSYDTSTTQDYSSSYDTTTTTAPYTTTTTSAYAASTTAYGSGSWKGSSSYDSCIQQCQASLGSGSSGYGSGSSGYGSGSSGYGSSSSSSGYGSSSGSTDTNSSSSSSSTNGLDALGNHLAGNPLLPTQPGQIITAPNLGNLTYLPFAMDVAAGSNATFMWGAGPHTVTQSSALTICNKTLQAGAFASGLQNASFQFPVTPDPSAPTFYYCGVPTHCEKGMFGIINPTRTSSYNESFAAYMVTMASSDASFATLMNETQTMTASSKAAWAWGSDFAVSQLPDWAKPVAMNQVLLTRQFYANQPELLAGNTLSSANSTDSTSSSSSAGSSATGAVAAEAAASTPAATTGAGNLSSQVSGWILGITFVLSAGIVL